MKKIFLGLVLVLSLSQICLSGHIYTWDVDLFYQNEKNAQKITIFFSLESGLAKGHYIRVKFPDSSSVTSGSLSQIGQTATVGSLTTVTSTSGDVFAQVGADVASYTWYQLVLNFDSISTQTAGYKGIIYMETASGGSLETNRIVYDSNSVAAVYQLAPKPTETLGFTVNYPTTVLTAQKTGLSSTYDIFFDLKPQVPIKGGTKLRVELDTVYWKLGSSCSGADQTCADGASGCVNITLVIGSCNVAPGNSYLELIATSDIVIDQTVRIKTTITNPSGKRSSAGVTAYSISKASNLIFEKKSLSSIFSIDGITPNKPTVKYLWGVSGFTSTKTKCLLGFYKKASSSRTTHASAAQIDVFNDLTLEFTVPTSTPAGQNLEVSIATPSADFTLVLGSIRTDLPVFSGKTQTISFASNTIVIRNVAPLASTSTYKLLAKVAFASSATGNSGFPISIKTIHDDGDLPLGSTGPAADFALVQNYEYLDLDTNGYHAVATAATNPTGYNFVFSNTAPLITGAGTGGADYSDADAKLFVRKLYYIAANAGSTTGYPGVALGTSAVQELVFILKPNLAQLCCGSATANTCEQGSHNTACISDTPASNVWAPSISLYMVANSNILNLDNSDGRNGVITYGSFWGGCGYLKSTTLDVTAIECFSKGKVATVTTGTGSTSVLKNQWDFTDSGLAYLQATCIPTATATSTSCVSIASTDSSADTVTTYSALGLRMKSGETSIFKSSLDKVSQLYGGQQVIDFVVCFGYNTALPVSSARPTTDLTYTLASQSLLNVYIMNYGDQVSNLRVSLFNYLQQDPSNDYYKAPIFLRVSGYVAANTYSALTVFLDNNIGISNAKQCTSTATSYSCAPFANSAPETGNPILRSRVDIISSISSGATSLLEFFIPIAPSTNSFPNTVFIDVGLSSIEDNYIALKEIYRVYGYLWGLHSTTRKLDCLAEPSWGGGTAYGQTAGDVNSGGTCADSATGFDLTTANFYPGYLFDSINLPTSVTSTCLGAENGDVLKGGTGFVAALYSGNHDFLGAGSAKWADSISCPKFRIDYSVSTTSNGFICGLVGSSSASTQIYADTKNIVLRSFTVPWSWGSGYTLPKAAYSWSGGAKGELRSFKVQANMNDVQYQRSCTTTDWGTVYKSSSFQRLSFTFVPTTGLDLTWDSFVFLASFADSLEGFSFYSGSSCSITLSSGTGTCVAVDTSDSSKTITITRDSVVSGTRGSLGKGTQTVVLSFSQLTTTKASSTYTAIIKNSGIKVDSCETAKAITFSSSDDTPLLSLGIPILQTSKGSRTSFQFSFTIGTNSRQIWRSTNFNFVLGWLGDSLSGVAANLHCFIRSGNSVSFQFRSLDLTNPATPSLAPSADLPLGTWTYVCNGARAPVLSVATKMTYTWKASTSTLGSIADDSTNAVSAVTMTDSQADLEASLSSKLWSTPGFEASYSFLFKPKKVNYTLDARIYVDFSIDIPPRGNKAGKPSCELNSTRCYCEWAQERRLVIWPVLPLTSLSTATQYSYLLNIHGIAQPALLGTFKSIGITLDADNNPNNGVSEWAEITDSSPSSGIITPLLISDYSNSVSVTRSNTELKLSFNLPKDIVAKDQRVYVDLPPYFGDSLWLISSVTCNLYRISDLTTTNLVQNCTILKNNRVKIFTNADSGSGVENIYVLSIGGIPTPAQPTTNVPNWLTVFLASADETVITHRTAAGYINATHPFYSHEAGKQVPDWFVKTAQGVSSLTGDLEVIIGTYRSEVILRSPTVSEVSYNYALGGEYISNLAVYPSTLKVNFGEADSRFRIAAKSNAVQGRYLVTASKSAEQNANKQTPIPTLPILVKNITCIVEANSENIKVPAGGWSLPIIFDFTDCMPVTDVQVDANFTDVDKYNISFGPDVTNTLASQKLVFESWNNTRVSFRVRSLNASQKAGLKTKISFSLSGTNKDSYGIPKVVNVELIDSAPYTTAPTVTSLSASAIAGQVTLSLGCSATGNIYFAIGTNPDVQSTIFADIKNSSFAKNVLLTPRDPADAWWKVYGFVSQPGTTALSVVIPGVKSAALYYAVAYCENQMEITSSNSLKTSWNQTDNGGRVSKATIVFNGTLTSDQQKDIACALAKLLKVPQNTVSTQDGVVCSTLRRLQTSSNISNSSNSTPAVQLNVTYSWFVLPDYAAAQAAVQTNLQSLMVAGFTDKLFDSTAGKASTFPSVRSFTFSAQTTANAPAPSVNEISPTINIFETYVTFDITLSNSSGYVYWGIGSNSSIRPLGRILRDKIDATGAALVAADRKYVPAKTLVSFNATSALVRNGTDYKLFISLSSDDPSPEASFSDVVEKSFKTKMPSFLDRTVIGNLMTCLSFVLVVIFL